MTIWAIKFGWNWLLLPFAAWFLNGLRKAILKPRLKYVSHTTQEAPSPVSSEGKVRRHLVSVIRQERLPPWRSLAETWLLHLVLEDGMQYTTRVLATREGDGALADSDLRHRLQGLVRVAEARQQETEELSK